MVVNGLPLENPNAWMDWVAILGYISFMVFVGYQVFTRSK